MFNILFRLCRKDEISFDIVAENGNVEATFDSVERIVQLVAFDSVAWTFLLVETGILQSCLLLRQCCWYGRGLRFQKANRREVNSMSTCRPITSDVCVLVTLHRQS